MDGKSGAVSAVVYWRENGLPKAPEENKAGMDLGNRCGGLIWSQITIKSSLNSPSSHGLAVTIHVQTGGRMLRNCLRNTKPGFEGVKPHTLNPRPTFRETLVKFTA